jgi:hypothetical protein
MNENNENDATHKSEINATMAFTQSLAAIVKFKLNNKNDSKAFN